MSRFPRLLSAFLMVCVIACGGGRDAKPSAATSSSVGKGRYAVKSGIVEIRSTMMDIRQTMYFDDYGARQATYTTARSGDSATSAVQIVANGEILEYNEQTRLGRRRADSAGQFQMPDIESLTPQMRKDYNVKELEDREYFGRKCKGYQMESMGTVSKTWVWGNISMYAEVTSPKGAFTMRVTSLETDVPVAAEKFRVPSDVSFR